MTFAFFGVFKTSSDQDVTDAQVLIVTRISESDDDATLVRRQVRRWRRETRHLNECEFTRHCMQRRFY